MINGYDIIDGQTGSTVGHAKTLKGASRSVNKRDNEYGAIRFYSRATYAVANIEELLFNAVREALAV